MWASADYAFVSDYATSYWLVPAVFINHDLQKKQERNPCITEYGKGVLLPKYTYGMAAMYTPFFFVGHQIAKMNNQQLDGYSAAYAHSIRYGCILYAILGLFVLSKILLKFFRDDVAAITLGIVFFGTNLFYYTLVESERIHATSFFLITLFLWSIIKWHEKKSYALSIVIGLLIGLITMVRPTDLIVFILFPLYDVKSFEDIILKLKLFIHEYKKVIIMGLVSFSVVLPQLIYWKAYTNEWFFYAYEGEHFFWTKPKWISYLFSYRNGWLLYTPIMIFGCVGIFLTRRHLRKFFIPLVVILILNVYVLSCWWCWWYMGFGNRSMVEFYGLYAIGIAVFLSYIMNLKFKKVRWNSSVKYIISTLIAFFICYNLFQVEQTANFILHYQGMNKKTYWMAFGKHRMLKPELDDFASKLTKVNWPRELRGKYR